MPTEENSRTNFKMLPTALYRLSKQLGTINVMFEMF